MRITARRLSDWVARTFYPHRKRPAFLLKIEAFLSRQFRCRCGNEAVRYGMCDECLEYPEG